jgi:predicted amidohydrolase YtcJ
MKADIIIKGKAIFDSINEKPYGGFVAISDDKLVAVERDINKADGFISSDTKVIDAGDRLVMPGFFDNHVHFLMAGMFSKYPSLIQAKSEEETAKIMSDFDKVNPADGWVLGFQWYHVFWEEVKMPSKKTLDKYFPDKPVFLLNAEAHGAWVNSKGLEIAGIDKNTPDPFGGEILRDEFGEPTGVLLEGAAGLASKYAFDLSKDAEKETLKAFLETAKAYGITSIMDVQPYFSGDMGSIPVYSEMDKDGSLTLRVHAAPDLLGDLDKVLETGKKYNSPKLRINYVKQFLDGVSTTHTALMLAPYADAPDETGIALFDTDAIEKAVPEAHKRGLSVKLHSCGDKSLRMALDYYQAALEKYGKNNARHCIEHCEIVSPEDIPRFGELGVIPSVQPEHVALTQTFAEMPYITTLGKELADTTWPFKSLLESAGTMAIGSDCPVVDSNPFWEIYRAVTRQFNDGEPKGGWNPTEKLSLYEVLHAYTMGSAYAASRENEIGSLEAGKYADVIIIDRNLFDVGSDKIMDSQVDLTIMDGKVVYER